MAVKARRRKASFQHWVSECMPNNWYRDYPYIQENEITGMWFFGKFTSKIIHRIAVIDSQGVVILEYGERYTALFEKWATDYEKYSGKRISVVFNDREDIPRAMEC